MKVISQSFRLHDLNPGFNHRQANITTRLES